MKSRLVLICIVLIAMTDALADRKIIQIGGGNKIDNSQGQIEDNVIWLNEILKRSSNDLVNYFAAGSGEVKDVSLYGDVPIDPVMEPITRIFDDRDAARLVFKSNQVPDISGSMKKDELIPALSGILETMDSDTDLLLIYNGHGGGNSEDVRLNTLKTWQDERLDVAEMDEILDHAPQEATVRFIFPQCYSGGFFYLIYDDPWSQQMAAQNRCGFFAESPYDESEGCSLDTNKEEYRDYSTYFFAPLNGATRNGNPLPINPDLNDDGAVSFRESHLYALMVGESKDLSRASSEMYLEVWEPWYLRWSNEENRDSIYWQIAEYIADVHGIGMNGSELAREKRRLQTEFDELDSQQQKYRLSIAEQSSSIRQTIIQRWPEMEHPYTSNYLGIMDSSASDIASAIQELSAYHKLVSMQDELEMMNMRALNLERDLAQIDKINRMKKLARLERQFSRFSSASEKRVYGQLLDCENGLFFTQ